MQVGKLYLIVEVDVNYKNNQPLGTNQVSGTIGVIVKTVIGTTLT